MKLKLAFFDIDGTLIWRNSRDGINLKSSSFNYALKKVFGLKNVSYLSVLGRRIYGLTDRSILRLTLKELGFDDREYYQNEKELFRAVDYYFEENLKRLKGPEYSPNPGAGEFLDFLKEKKIKMGLITGNIRKHSEWKMRSVGFERYFSTGAFGEDGENRAEIMRIALERNSETPGSQICHFGDSPLDLEAAKQFDIKGVGIAKNGGGTHSREELEEVGYGLVVDGWSNIEKITNYLSEN